MTFYILLFSYKIKIKIVAGLISAGPVCAVPVAPTLSCLANTVAADLPFLLDLRIFCSLFDDPQALEQESVRQMFHLGCILI